MASTGVPNDHLHTLTSTLDTRRRPIPSPLQETTSARSASEAAGLRNASLPDHTVRDVPNQDQATALNAPALTPNRLRTGRRALKDPAFDEIKGAVTRDVLREEASKTAAATTHATALRTFSAPALAATAAAPRRSPPLSPTMISSPQPAARADNRPLMARNTSIDSTISSVSTGTATSQKPNGSTGYRIPSDTGAPQDVGSAIAAAGSAEAALQKLLNEKSQAASHNAQLWRLVEKQRAMILGLNKDLEKAMKEKERYRRNFKDHLAQSESTPALGGVEPEKQLDARDNSQSPAMLNGRSDGTVMTPVLPGNIRDISLDSRKFSDASDVTSIGAGRSDIPQDTAQVQAQATTAAPEFLHLARSDSLRSSIVTESERMHRAHTPKHIDTRVAAPLGIRREIAGTPPVSPRMVETPRSPRPSAFHEKTDSTSSAISPPATANSFSSPKQVRKAPPAPLQLSPRYEPAISIQNNIMDASGSDYEDEPDSARSEKLLRGRRKTREDDDKEREELARQEDEHRSRSKPELSKSKSKSKVDLTESTETGHVKAVAPPQAVPHQPENKTSNVLFDAAADPALLVRQRTLSGAAGILSKSVTGPALLSPGLPMSPRPGDRPMGSPMPRAPMKMMHNMPMSPKGGMAGLPLSPRAPKHAIPLPPQTPLTFASPHLARAEVYHQQAQSQRASIADRLQPASESSTSDHERSISSVSSSSGDVYKGLMTEQYPELLLPPNALPSISVKTSSSRLRPSRQSYIAPKHPDENPVLTLAVHGRSDGKALWRVEKTLGALAALDGQIKSACSFRDRLPDRTLFSGHAPAKIDARRAALDVYLERMLDAITDERAAKVLCKFLSTDAIAAEAGDPAGGAAEPRPDTPIVKVPTHKDGYLTKRGKNFGGWKARYFVLDGPALKYFEGPGGAHLGSIKLQNAQIGKQSQTAASSTHEDEENQFRHAFLVLEPKKKDSNSLVRHVLCAESDAERDSWVEVLLQYVDYNDADDAGKIISAPRLDIGAVRSPRLQKSMNDLRPSSRSQESVQSKQDTVRSLHYNQTVAGEAPIIGPGSGRAASPSPPRDDSFGPAFEQAGSSHPVISRPTNLQVISNAKDWGMSVPPPTPHSKELAKDKKRSMFSAFRGRSSSDLAPGDKNAMPAHPQDGRRAVFGVPLAEAVELAHPADATTELPAVIYRCIEYLTYKNAIAEEGIFRLSGSNTVIKSLKDRFNDEGDVNLVADNQYYDIHAVASLLKLYLRELPSSILTRELHLQFLKCLELHGHEKSVALNVLVNKLPRANRALLQALSGFLTSIVNNADVNKMNVRNGTS